MEKAHKGKHKMAKSKSKKVDPVSKRAAKTTSTSSEQAAPSKRLKLSLKSHTQHLERHGLAEDDPNSTSDFASGCTPYKRAARVVAARNVNKLKDLPKRKQGNGPTTSKKSCNVVRKLESNSQEELPPLSPVESVNSISGHDIMVVDLDDSDKTHQSETLQKICGTCRAIIPEEDYPAHLKECMKNKYSRVKPKKCEKSDSTSEKPTDLILCQICQMDLSDFGIDAKQQHVNTCMDTSGSGQMSRLETDEATAEVLQQREKDKVREDMLSEQSIHLCHVCHKDLTHLNSHRRTLHINRCLDGAADDEEEKRKRATEIDEARQKILDCPICGRHFKTANSRRTHLKRCSIQHKVSVINLRGMIQKQEDTYRVQLEAGIFPQKSTRRQAAKVGPRRPTVRGLASHPPTSVLDEDTQLAIALSTSLMEQSAQPASSAKPEAASSAKPVAASSAKPVAASSAKPVAASRVEPDSASRDVAASTSYGKDAFSILMSPQKEEHPTKKKKGKKIKDVVSRLLLQSSQESRNKLANRVAHLMLPQEDVAPPPSPHFKRSHIKVRHREGDMECVKSVWEITALTESDQPSHAQFYVPALDSQIHPSTVCAGSKLKNMSTIPGWKPTEQSQKTVQKPVPGTHLDDTTLIASTQTAVILAELDGGVADCTTLGADCTTLGALDQTGFCLQLSPQKNEKTPANDAGGLACMVNNSDLSDLKVVTQGGHILFAHKFALITKGAKLRQCVLSGDSLDLSSHSRDAVLALLRYLYLTDTDIEYHLAPELKELADRFEIPELNRVCLDIQMKGAPPLPSAAPSSPGDPPVLDEHDVTQDRGLQAVLKDMWGEESESDSDVEQETEVQAVKESDDKEMDELYEFMLTQKAKQRSEESDDSCGEAEMFPADDGQTSSSRASVELPQIIKPVAIYDAGAVDRLKLMSDDEVIAKLTCRRSSVDEELSQALLQKLEESFMMDQIYGLSQHQSQQQSQHQSPSVSKQGTPQNSPPQGPQQRSPQYRNSDEESGFLEEEEEAADFDSSLDVSDGGNEPRSPLIVAPTGNCETKSDKCSELEGEDDCNIPNRTSPRAATRNCETVKTKSDKCSELEEEECQILSSPREKVKKLFKFKKNPILPNNFLNKTVKRLESDESSEDQQEEIIHLDSPDKTSNTGPSTIPVINTPSPSFEAFKNGTPDLFDASPECTSEDCDTSVVIQNDNAACKTPSPDTSAPCSGDGDLFMSCDDESCAGDSVTRGSFLDEDEDGESSPVLQESVSSNNSTPALDWTMSSLQLKPLERQNDCDSILGSLSPSTVATEGFSNTRDPAAGACGSESDHDCSVSCASSPRQGKLTGEDISRPRRRNPCDEDLSMTDGQSDDQSDNCLFDDEVNLGSGGVSDMDQSSPVFNSQRQTAVDKSGIELKHSESNSCIAHPPTHEEDKISSEKSRISEGDDNNNSQMFGCKNVGSVGDSEKCFSVTIAPTVPRGRRGRTRGGRGRGKLAGPAEKVNVNNRSNSIKTPRGRPRGRGRGGRGLGRGRANRSSINAIDSEGENSSDEDHISKPNGSGASSFSKFLLKKNNGMNNQLTQSKFNKFMKALTPATRHILAKKYGWISGDSEEEDLYDPKLDKPIDSESDSGDEDSDLDLENNNNSQKLDAATAQCKTPSHEAQTALVDIADMCLPFEMPSVFPSQCTFDGDSSLITKENTISLQDHGKPLTVCVTEKPDLSCAYSPVSPSSKAEGQDQWKTYYPVKMDNGSEVFVASTEQQNISFAVAMMDASMSKHHSSTETVSASGGMGLVSGPVHTTVCRTDGKTQAFNVQVVPSQDPLMPIATPKPEKKSHTTFMSAFYDYVKDKRSTSRKITTHFRCDEPNKTKIQILPYEDSRDAPLKPRFRILSSPEDQEESDSDVDMTPQFRIHREPVKKTADACMQTDAVESTQERVVIEVLQSVSAPGTRVVQSDDLGIIDMILAMADNQNIDLTAGVGIPDSAAEVEVGTTSTDHASTSPSSVDQDSVTSPQTPYPDSYFSTPSVDGMSGEPASHSTFSSSVSSSVSQGSSTPHSSFSTSTTPLHAPDPPPGLPSNSPGVWAGFDDGVFEQTYLTSQPPAPSNKEKSSDPYLYETSPQRSVSSSGSLSPPPAKTINVVLSPAPVVFEDDCPLLSSQKYCEIPAAAHEVTIGGGMTPASQSHGVSWSPCVAKNVDKDIITSRTSFHGIEDGVVEYDSVNDNDAAVSHLSSPQSVAWSPCVPNSLGKGRMTPRSSVPARNESILEYDPPTDMDTDVSMLMAEANQSDIWKDENEPVDDHQTKVQSVEPPRIEPTPMKRTKKSWTAPSPYTPMPDYDQMETPRLQKACQRYGIRKMPKKKMKAVLKDVYHQTHQYETDPECGTNSPVTTRLSASQPLHSERESGRRKSLKRGIDSDDLRQKSPKKKRQKKAAASHSRADTNSVDGSPSTEKVEGKKKGRPFKTKNVDNSAKSAFYHKTTTSVSSIATAAWSGHRTRLSTGHSLSSDSESSTSAGPEILEESTLFGEEMSADSKPPSKRDVLFKRKQMWDYIVKDQDLYTKILHYEPLEFAEFHMQLKKSGINIGAQNLSNFLDDHNIQFTMRAGKNANAAEGSGKPKRKWGTKRKTKAKATVARSSS